MAEEDEGAIGADLAIGAEGAAIYILLDGYDTMGIGYMTLWGLGAKCVSGVGEWVIPLSLLRLLEHLRC